MIVLQNAFDLLAIHAKIESNVIETFRRLPQAYQQFSEKLVHILDGIFLWSRLQPPL